MPLCSNYLVISAEAARHRYAQPQPGPAERMQEDSASTSTSGALHSVTPLAQVERSMS